VPDRKATMASLRGVPLFATASDKELRRVADVAREERFRTGEDIVTEGRPSGPFFLLTGGDAEVLVGGEAKSKLGPGDFFGEMSLIDGAPRSATIRAITDVTALAITSWDFLALLERNWDLTRAVMVELTKRVRAHDQDPCL
jgi:CRP/FNR family transcriptional regulator, cyclic AMP receptor protein